MGDGLSPVQGRHGDEFTTTAQGQMTQGDAEDAGGGTNRGVRVGTLALDVSSQSAHARFSAGAAE